MSTETEGLLTPQRVDTIFTACLFKEGEDYTDHVTAEGIVNTVAFHPGRLEQHRQEIRAMLAELSEGWTGNGFRVVNFLHIGTDKHGNTWTGMHRTMEQLVQLGIGIGEVEYLLERVSWDIHPGGMPYLIIKQ